MRASSAKRRTMRGEAACSSCRILAASLVPASSEASHTEAKPPEPSRSRRRMPPSCALTDPKRSRRNCSTRVPEQRRAERTLAHAHPRKHALCSGGLQEVIHMLSRLLLNRLANPRTASNAGRALLTQAQKRGYMDRATYDAQVPDRVKAAVEKSPPPTQEVGSGTCRIEANATRSSIQSEMAQYGVPQKPPTKS